MGEYQNIKITNIERKDPQETPCTLPQDKQDHCVIANCAQWMYANTANIEITKTERNKVPRGENVHQIRDSMNEKLPQEAGRGCALRMSSPPKKVVKSEAGGAAFRMHVARATMVTPRSSLLCVSFRVDRGDVGP